MKSQSNNKIKIKQSKASKLRLTLGLSIILVWIVIGFYAFKDVKNFVEWFEDLGPFAPILFTIMLSFAVVILVPTPILKVGAGAIFPFWMATLVNFIASVVGGLLAFLLGRWLFRDAISDIVASDDRLLRLEQAISEEAMQISILVRLSPLIPDEWLNYVMASGPVSTRVFVISNMSSLVYSVAYAYFGYVAGKIVLSGDGLSGFKDSPSGYVMLLIGVIASVIVTVIIMRITMKALDTKIAVE